MPKKKQSDIALLFTVSFSVYVLTRRRSLGKRYVFLLYMVRKMYIHIRKCMLQNLAPAIDRKFDSLFSFVVP